MDEWTSLSTDDGKKRGDPAEKVMIANCIPGVVVSARWLVSSAGYSPGCRATAEGCPLQNRKEKSSIQLRIDKWYKNGNKKIPPFNFIPRKIQLSIQLNPEGEKKSFQERQTPSKWTTTTSIGYPGNSILYQNGKGEMNIDKEKDR
jgi:hypothetical protein